MDDALKGVTKLGAVAQVLPIVGWLRTYETTWLRADILAGLTLWGILVPEAIAYAVMARAPPQAGLYTLLASLLVYAVLGTTRQAVSASTSGSSIMMAAVVTPFLVTNPNELGELPVVLFENSIRLRSRTVGQNHRMIADDVRDPAFARNVRYRLLQVAAPT